MILMLSFSLPLPVVFLYIHIYSFLPGTSMRNPTRGKGHEEGSLTKRKGVIRLQGLPLEFPEHPPRKTRVCLLYCVILSTYSSDINRGLSPHRLFLEKVNLELLDNKSPGHNKSVSIQKPLWWLSSLPAGLLQLCMWLFAASRRERHRKLKTS